MQTATTESRLSESIPVARPSVPNAAYHGVLLGLAAGIVLLSCVLRIEADRSVLIPLLDVPLPGVCSYQRLFGIDCPGCGLTRCFISLGHGDLSAAWRFNATGLLGFVLVATQIPYRITQLVRLQLGQPELRLDRMGQAAFGTFFVLLLIQWLARTFFL